MVLKGDANRYGVLAATLHWVSAAAIITLLLLGFLAAQAPDAAVTAALLRLHVPLGLLVTALTVGRLVWWLVDRRPADAAGPRWQALTAHATHVLLYGLLILMGASGIALMIASGAGPILFARAARPLPDFSQFRPMAGHAAGAFALVALLALHVGATLYHHLYRRDGLLLRMGVGSGHR